MRGERRERPGERLYGGIGERDTDVDEQVAAVFRVAEPGADGRQEAEDEAEDGGLLIDLQLEEVMRPVMRRYHRYSPLHPQLEEVMRPVMRRYHRYSPLHTS